MKRLMMLCALLLLGSLCFAAEQKKPTSVDGTAAAGQVKQEQPPTPPAVTQEKQSPTWPRPYKPREEISADTVVAFPTDI